MREIQQVGENDIYYNAFKHQHSPTEDGSPCVGVRVENILGGVKLAVGADGLREMGGLFTFEIVLCRGMC